LVADWFSFIRLTGLQVAEYAQQTKSKIDVHKYPSGKRVMKAFLPTDWAFYDKNQKTPIRRSNNSPKENESNFQDSEE
jgi:hypothetical protein